MAEQIQAEPNAQRREALQDDFDALKAQIDAKTAKLSNYINPPQKPAPKTYAPVNAAVAQEISRLNRQILDMPDESTSSVSAINKRLAKLLNLNQAVATQQDTVTEAGRALQAARAHGDERAQIAAKIAFESVNDDVLPSNKR